MFIKADSLVCRFGAAPAVVKGVDLTVSKGELCALIGPNGAGKSTLLKMLSGSLRPSDGKVILGDRELTGRPIHEFARAGIARKFQTPSLFDELTVGENLLLAESAVDRRRANSAVGPTLHKLGMESLINRRASELAFGQRQWLEIGLAIIGEPTFLLLDEPVAGLSSAERERTRELVVRISEDVGVILTEHDLDLVEALSCRTVVIREGEIVGDGSLKEVRRELPEGKRGDGHA